MLDQPFYRSLTRKDKILHQVELVKKTRLKNHLVPRLTFMVKINKIRPLIVNLLKLLVNKRKLIL